MRSMIPAMIALAVSNLPVATNAATMPQQSPDSMQDTIVSILLARDPKFGDDLDVVRLKSFDPCSCEEPSTYALAPNTVGFRLDFECITDNNHAWFSNTRTINNTMYSCECGTLHRFAKIADDGIRGHMRNSDDLLTVVPLWVTDDAHQFERTFSPAPVDNGCAAGGGDIGSIGSSASYLGTHGLARAVAGGALTGGGSSGFGAGGIGGNSTTGSGSSDDGLPPFDDGDADLLTPIPLPAAGLMFLSGLFVLGLVAALRQRLALVR